MSNFIDTHIGRRIATRRKELGLSAQELSLQLGIPYSEYQDSENGRRRVGAERLHRLSKLLDVEPTYFVQGAESDGQLLAKPQKPRYADFVRMLKGFAAIQDAEIRAKMLRLALGVLASND